MIFYALLDLAKRGAYGIVQDVFILGTTVTAPLSTWLEVRSVVSGRFVNAYARNDWVLNYLFRATSGGLNTVAGLRAVENVPGLENVDVTDKIAGHMSYRTFMPLILDQLGFPVSADYFDEPEVCICTSAVKLAIAEITSGFCRSPISREIGSLSERARRRRRKAGSAGRRNHRPLPSLSRSRLLRRISASLRRRRLNQVPQMMTTFHREKVRLRR